MSFTEAEISQEKLSVMRKDGNNVNIGAFVYPPQKREQALAQHFGSRSVQHIQNLPDKLPRYKSHLARG